MAALVMSSGSVPMATVKTEGTLTRIFSMERAPLRLHSIWMGSRESQAYSCTRGRMKAAPPWMQREVLPPPTFP